MSTSRYHSSTATPNFACSIRRVSLSTLAQVPHSMTTVTPCRRRSCEICHSNEATLDRTSRSHRLIPRVSIDSSGFIRTAAPSELRRLAGWSCRFQVIRRRSRAAPSMTVCRDSSAPYSYRAGSRQTSGLPPPGLPRTPGRDRVSTGKSDWRCRRMRPRSSCIRPLV